MRIMHEWHVSGLMMSGHVQLMNIEVSLIQMGQAA